MRISDWSSDVCSSDFTGDYRIAVRWDLSGLPAGARAATTYADGDFTLPAGPIARLDRTLFMAGVINEAPHEERGGFKDRKSVVSGKSVSVRVGLGGRRIIKKKKHKQTKRNVCK